MFDIAKLFSSKSKRNKKATAGKSVNEDNKKTASKNKPVKAVKTKKKTIITVICASLIAVGAPIAVFFILNAPVRSTVTIEGGLAIAIGETLSPDIFVKDIIDNTNVSIDFKEPPDFSVIGKQDISIIIKDEDRNITEVLTKIFIFDINKNEGITIEVGTPLTEIPIRDFLIKDDSLAEMRDIIPMVFEKSINQTQADTVGNYDVSILLNDIPISSKINVKDTTPPTGNPISIDVWLGKTPEPLDFIEDAHDYSEFTAVFQPEPDFTLEGTQEITVILRDIWGNSAEFTSTLTITKDTIPPEIRGVQDLTFARGANIIYRTGVTAWDNADGDIDFEVDSSAVNIDVLGEYPVVYTAVDSSGNAASITITLTVVEFTPESVMETIDNILVDIIDDSMNDTEKARAIHRWVRGRISYGGSADREVYRAAHRGLQRRTGDCYTYFAISKLMLDRVGINNVDITRTPGARSTNHYWSLIEIDGQWYHFDSTPNIFGVQGFMLTAQQAANISANSRSRGYYAYDPSLYPPIA